jgi:predicted alpha/beta superfamily hydrolase
MIKKLISLILILFYFCGFSQEIITKDIDSEILETKRQIKIYLPRGYEESSLKKYPLAVVLDADYLFDTFVGNAILFSEKDKAPKQIVVGISMESTRKKDTYFKVSNGDFTGNNKEFYNFIRDEVILYMESNFRVSPFISLVGEGTSANLITRFLSEANPFVNSYICINPSFSDFIVNQLLSYNFPRFVNEDNTFYFYSNNTTSFSQKKQANINQLQTALASIELKNFNVINDVIDTRSSVSAMSEAIPRALTSIFEVYSSISKQEYEKNIKELSPLDAIAYLENKYVEIEFLFGTNLGIRERDIYAIENIIIEKEDGDNLREFGKMILTLFPTSPLGEYYIGRYYEIKNLNKQALRFYKIGYGKMNPSNPNADKFYENVLRLSGQ